MQTQYQVPQFIDTEDHIVGPLTLKQFFIVAVGLGLAGLFFIVLRLSFAIMLSIPVVTFAFVMAFLRVHGMPMWRYLASVAQYITSPQEYFWKK